MSAGQRGKRSPTSEPTNMPRHAALRRTPPKRGPETRLALSALRQRRSRLTHPVPISELDGWLAAPDAPAWPGVIRVVRTQAFYGAMVAGLCFTWITAAAIPQLMDRMPRAEHGPTGIPPPNALESGPAAYPAPATPPLGKAKIPEQYWQNFFSELAELDQHANRVEVPVPHQAPPSIHCVPTCLDLLPPESPQAIDPPHATVEAPSPAPPSPIVTSQTTLPGVQPAR
jgi:hypothetical protein